jgi:spore germination cell wall hydrolase CwlJ-like protein
MTIKRRVLALAFASFALLAAGQSPEPIAVAINDTATDARLEVDLNTAIQSEQNIAERTAALNAAAVPLQSAEKPTAAPLATMVADNAPQAMSDELKCLATAVYFEARGEPLEGQLAVAQVILNRVATGRFASSICGVVNQPGQFTFSRNRAPLAASSDWKIAQAIATIAQDGTREIAPRAIAFHAARLAPNWSNMEKVSKIGNHVFYR